MPTTCTDFRANYPNCTKRPYEVEEELRNAWREHLDVCSECGDWYQGEQVRERGANPGDYPCVHLAYRVTHHCEHHDDPWECADYVIVYSAKFDEYGIPVRDGGSSKISITHCPWCGIALPESKRDEWFRRLEALGYENPWADDVPEEFKSDVWWRRGGREQRGEREE